VSLQILFYTTHCAPHRTGRNYHRWTRLLKQQSSITAYRLPTKENKFPFSVSVLQETNGSCFLSFAAQHWTVDTRYQNPKPLGAGGKARILTKMYSVQTVLFCQTCSASPVLPVLSAWPVLPVLFCLSRSVFPVLPVLFCLSHSSCPVQPVLFCLSCSACPVLAALSWQFFPGSPLLTVWFCLFCSACHVSRSSCPVISVLF
jgi:hypothetical protein